jgi:hypothetical protein
VLLVLNIQTPYQVDDAKYEENIGASGSFCYVDKNKYLLSLSEFKSLSVSSKAQLCDLLSYYSGGIYNDINKISLFNTLTTYCGISDGVFLKKSKSSLEPSLSVRQDKVLTPLKQSLENEFPIGPSHLGALHIVDAYLEYTSYKTLVSDMSTKVCRFIDTDAVGNNNEPLSKVIFSYNRQSTGRYYTSNDSLQNWPLKSVNCITASKGKFFIWCDFKNVDLRVAFNTYLKNDKHLHEYASTYTDMYEAFVRSMCDSLKISFDYDTFKANRQGFKKGILSRIYNSRINTIAKAFSNKQLAGALDSYFVHNEDYQKYKDLVERVINWKGGIVLPLTDYFGSSREIYLSGMSYKANWEHALSQGLNTPIQSTTNSIVETWVNCVIQKYRDAGYSPDEVSVALIRHDEAVLEFGEETVKDMQILADCMQVAIDDWSLLELDPEFGYNYKVPDDNLRSLYTKCLETHKDSLTPRLVMKARKIPYVPVGDIIDCYCVTVLKPCAFCKSMLPSLAVSESITYEEAMSLLTQHYDELDDDHKETFMLYCKFGQHTYVYSKYSEHHWVLKACGQVFQLCDKYNIRFINLYNLTSDMFQTYKKIYYSCIKTKYNLVSTYFDRIEQNSGGVCSDTQSTERFSACSDI